MKRFIKVFAIMAVLVAVLAPPVIAWLQASPLADPGALPVGGPGTPRGDPFPNLPPLSELARLPSADIVADWWRLQRAVMEEAKARMDDRTLPPELRG